MSKNKEPIWTITLKARPRYEYASVTSMLRALHGLGKYGVQVETVACDGHEYDLKAIRRLNHWITVYGAWNASKLSYFLAYEALERVLTADCPLVDAKLKIDVKALRLGTDGPAMDAGPKSESGLAP